MPSPRSGKAREARSIVLVVSNLGLGGAERQLFYLAHGLARRGWKVTVAIMIPWLDPSFAEPLAKAGARVEILQNQAAARPAPLLRATIALRRLVRAERPAVMVGFMPHGALLARLIGRLEKVPKIVTSLRSIQSTHRWHDWLLAMTRGLDDAVVANSAIAAEAQLHAGVTTDAKSTLIPNGFDPSRVAGTGEGKAESSSLFQWLNIAVVRHEKDHQSLLQAARLLREQGRSFHLDILGTGPLLEEMRTMAAGLDLAGTVEFLGQRSDVFDSIARADAFVLSSLWESLPNVLIEAHAGGLPIVCTRVGGCGEIVIEGVSGDMVQPSDPEALARAMARLMDRPEAERRAMGEAGRDHVLSAFSMERMVDRWETLLSQ